VLDVARERDPAVKSALVLGIPQRNALRSNLMLGGGQLSIQIRPFRRSAVICFSFLTIKIISCSALLVDRRTLISLCLGFGGCRPLIETLALGKQLSLQLLFREIP
jgi:hypothetical protein